MQQFLWHQKMMTFKGHCGVKNV